MDDPIIVNLDAFKGAYNSLELGVPYKIGYGDKQLSGIYTFQEDESGYSCNSCALKTHRKYCKSCFDCFNRSARLTVDVIPVVAPQEETTESNDDQETTKELAAWEVEVQEIEKQIIGIETNIEERMLVVKGLKKEIAKLHERRREVVIAGSRGYAKSHPLFTDLDE